MTENVIEPKRSRGRPMKYHNEEFRRLAYSRQINLCTTKQNTKKENISVCTVYSVLNPK